MLKQTGKSDSNFKKKKVKTSKNSNKKSYQVKGVWRYGNKCYRKCKSHKKFYSHFSENNLGIVKHWQRNNSPHDFLYVEKEEQLL